MTTNLYHRSEDPVDDRGRGADVAVADQPPVAWGAPDRTLLQRIEPRFVVSSWALCLLASLAIAALGVLVVSLVSQAPLTGETNTELGVLMILAAMGTFIGFVTVMSLRLVRASHDRLVNSMAVAALHVAVAALLILADLAVFGIFGVHAGSGLTGPWTDTLGNVIVVLERSSVAAIAACLLAAGMVPAMGGRPAGTQTAATPTDQQL